MIQNVCVIGFWKLLKRHVNDQSINGKGASATFDIEPTLVQNRSFSKFRVRQTAVNSNSHHYLACSGFEVYGTVGQCHAYMIFVKNC